MRGLILNCVGKHAEAQESVKRGLKVNFCFFQNMYFSGNVIQTSGLQNSLFQNYTFNPM